MKAYSPKLFPSCLFPGTLSQSEAQRNNFLHLIPTSASENDDLHQISLSAIKNDNILYGSPPLGSDMSLPITTVPLLPGVVEFRKIHSAMNHSNIPSREIITDKRLELT